MLSAEEHPLACLFDPSSIAIIGASDDPNKLSGRLLLNLRRHGYRGTVYPVNARRERVLGERCYPSVAALGETPALVMLATPAAAAAEAMQEAIACGAKAFVIYASGFAELDAKGAERQAQLSALARSQKAVLLGPNCAGFMSAHASLCGSFSTIADQMTLVCGGLSFAGQSGAMAAYWLDAALQAGLGFARWVSTGNEAEVDIADVITFLAADPLTDTICVYIVGTRDGFRLREAFRAAVGAGKPVLALRGGTIAGRRQRGRIAYGGDCHRQCDLAGDVPAGRCIGVPLDQRDGECCARVAIPSSS
jgi:acyl-CoA synthetase (NDP forming)